MATDREAYDVTNRIFDRLESRGVPITDDLATVIRGIAASIADLVAEFEREAD